MPSPDPLDLSVPLIAAPMAGGPTTPALVVAAARAGGLGFLAAGYRTPDDLREQIAAARAAAVPFGVNLFVPNPVPVEPAAYGRYRSALQAEASRYAVSLPEDPREDDDHWPDKVDALLADPVPVVSFTFGVPDAGVFAAFRKAGTRTVQTVTSPAEARLADAADALVVQAPAAGGHSGTLTPGRPVPATTLLDLIAAVRAVTGRPLLAAGGLGTAADVAAVLNAGAVAAVVGTVLLLADESGTSAPYRKALAVGGRDTVVTHAFSGRPARALRNGFVDRYAEVAPAGYPAVHHLTSPLRKAAALRDDAELINLWAGTGYRHARAAPLADVFTRLSAHSP
jgi:nitronate monooxygenase